MRRLLFAVLLFAACRCATSDIPRKSIDDAMNRSVWIDVVLANGDSGNCSGVVIETGKVLTAKHCTGVKMTVNGKEAKIVASDDKDDLILLSVKSPDYTRVQIADVPQVGAKIFAVATVTDLPSVFSEGRVMAVAHDYAEFHMRPLVSTASTPGVSGGGVYDIMGRLIGVTVQYRVAPFMGPNDTHNYALVCGTIVEGSEIARFLRAAKA